MNKTVAFVSLAAGLALTALVLGLPQLAPPHPATPVPPPRPATASNGSLTMTSRLSHPYITPGSSDLFVTVDLTGAEVPGSKRTPVNLAVVIDRSGSMSGYKLQQAKQAARHLVGLLGPEDRLAIVHYGSDVKSLPSLSATPANRERMLQFIEGIWDDGGTNIGAGLHAGRSHVVAARGDYSVNRIILMSDGQATEGITDDAGLTEVVKGIRAEGITVSSIGVGTDFNEDLMQGFAEYGAGAYGFLEDAGQLATLFQKDLQQAATSVARNVELSFTLPEGVVLGEVLGYRAHQDGRTVRVPMPDFSSGQVERVVARLTVVGTKPGSAVDVTGLKLTYTDLLKNAGVESAASLSAMVTERREEVLARQDKDATVYATRALSAKNLKLAAEALRDGRKEEAKGYVIQNQALFEQASQVASPAAVEADLAEQKAVLLDYEQANDDEARGAAVKRTKSQAAKSFGKIGSVY
ncbi:VWA domain-containing protein [Vitiosangium sp. GDMCC 1.1324]|uniref:vWA domain-containing protein n=1 Tax=Vitiosangium sp. (strain GDMCC 1.1324) TaxID=2138576 RepID=UPI000D3B74C6|nr:VWA domain-containing protein [Vitiosangium sp. GDMCC 1.1324]PTL80404.1 VWA domain-containing protein [Vitiosangium sp. GDMCC 1.1324]